MLVYRKLCVRTKWTTTKETWKKKRNMAQLQLIFYPLQRFFILVASMLLGSIKRLYVTKVCSL